MTFSKKKVHYFNPKRTMKKKVKKVTTRVKLFSYVLTYSLLY